MLAPLPAWLRTVHHDGSSLFVSNPEPSPGETITLRLRVGARAPVRRAFLRTAPDGEQAFTELRPEREDALARWLAAPLPLTEPLVHYRFVLEAEDGVFWYTAAGPRPFDPLDATDFRIAPGGAAPAWVRRSVFYQVFPDRFANGDPALDPRPDGWPFPGEPRTFAWEEPPGDHPFARVFYGGDLPGLASRLDHLVRLGVNALYLNPVFTAPSNHRYDVADYARVDPHLGGDAALARLREALTARDLRYLLDVVPNHAGSRHPWFLAAQADAAAPEASFFTFACHPDDYATWLGVKTLPKLDYRSAELRRRMFEDEDAVLRRWLRPPYSADGWRVDVANMLGRQGAVQLGRSVASALRAAVKEARPDAYLLGENFFDASAQVQGDGYDGMMNYAGFAFPLWHWLRGYRQEVWRHEELRGPPFTTGALEAAWRERRAAVPWSAALHAYNLVDSHDVPRIRTVVGGRDALHRLAAVAQFAYVGVPGLYYGDEIGMVDDPGLAQRGCMIWDERRWDGELFDFYRRLIALRRGSRALQEGSFEVLAAEPDTLAFLREVAGERVVAVLHRGASARPADPIEVAPAAIPDGTRFVEHFSGQQAIVQAGALPQPVQPQGATLWRAA